jgi:excisionase family DNA binding protein
MEKRDKLLLTVKDVAAFLQVNQTTIYRLLRKSEIPGFKLGGDWRFNLESIDKWRLAAGEKPTRRTRPRAKSASLRRTGTESASNAEAQLSSPSLLAELQLPSVLAQLHLAINRLMEPLAELRGMIPTLKGITDGAADPCEASDEDAEISEIDGKSSSIVRETVLDSAPIAYGLVDRQRRMVSYNDAFCELFEYSRQQLRARDFFDLMCEEDRAIYMMIFTKLLTGEPEAAAWWEGL